MKMENLMQNYSQPIRYTYKVALPIKLTSDHLANYFSRILKKGYDFAVTVYGDKGYGKSISTAELMRKISIINKTPFFSKENPDLIKTNIVFYAKDFYKALLSSEKYSTIMLDDFGSELDARRSMSNEALDVSHHFQTSRLLHKGYFITTPTATWINKDTRERAANYYIWITSKNTELGFCTARVFYLQKNEIKRKIYQHNLCLSPGGYINNRGIGNPIKTWTLYPLPEELQKIYEPYRIEKGDRNVQKGIDNLERIDQENKAFLPPTEIVKKILCQKENYLCKLKTKDEYRWDKGLIGADFGVGGRKIEQIISLLKRETQQG